MHDDEISEFNGETPNRKISGEQNKLSNENQVLKDQIREERFLFLLCIIVLLDVIFFIKMDGWGPIAIVILQAIGILIVAKRFGIEEIPEFLASIFHKRN